MVLICDGGITSCNVADTMDAIMLSKNINYIDGIKLDVRISKDNILVLAISNELKDFTSSNKRISEENYDYLRKVKFPSHIFKYYITTLEEVLQGFNHDKKIVLELYDSNNIDLYFQMIYQLVIKYSYDYYFLSENNNLLDNMKNSKLKEVGKILDQNQFRKTNNYEDVINSKNLFIISQRPEKIHKYHRLFDKK